MSEIAETIGVIVLALAFCNIFAFLVLLLVVRIINNIEKAKENDWQEAARTLLGKEADGG